MCVRSAPLACRRLAGRETSASGKSPSCVIPNAHQRDRSATTGPISGACGPARQPTRNVRSRERGFFGSLRREAHPGRGRVRSEATCTVLGRPAGLPGTDLKGIKPRLEVRGRVRGIVVAKRGCCGTPSHSANSTLITPTPPKGAGVYNQCIYRFVSNSARRYSRIES